MAALSPDCRDGRVSVGKGDLVRIGRGSGLATVVTVTKEQDAAGQPYEMAILRGARDREFREEVSRLSVVKKAGVK